MTGCSRDSGQPLGAEIDESEFRRGQKLVKQGRHQEALASYLRVIEKRGESAPESHLEVGILYLQQIKDPLAAIYHLRKYLEGQPNSPQSPQVRGLVDSAKREFARTLPANPLENQSERLNMLDQIGRLQRENNQLKEALARARGNIVPPRVDNSLSVLSSPLSVAPMEEEEGPVRAGISQEPVRSKPTPPPTKTRLHTVEKGDTLFVLAQRYYDNRAKWRDIYAANRDVMPNENSLQIGMVLKIP
jgi:tetratricopeptide (TPR) repeat protein